MKFLIVIGLVTLALAGCTSAEAGNEVDMLATSFGPDSMTISVGESVTFVGVEASHTVDFAEGEAAVAGVSQAHSGNVDSGESFTVTFTEPGTYSFFCRYHSGLSGGERVGMVGTIIVT